MFINTLLEKPINSFKGVITRATTTKSTGRLNDLDIDMVALNQQAYNQQNNREQNIRGYRYDANSSNTEIATYIGKGLLVIVFKGTTNTQNFVEDILLSLNVQPKTLEQSVRQFDNITRKYRGSGLKPFITGHSLGGVKALHIATHRVVSGIVFNPYIATNSRTFVKYARTPLIKKYIIKNDLASTPLLSLNPTNVTIMVLKKQFPTVFERHSISTFTNQQNFK